MQVIATILGADLENPHDIVSINGASAALMVSGIPFNGPIGAVRMAHHDGEWIAHPTYSRATSPRSSSSSPAVAPTPATSRS